MTEHCWLIKYGTYQHLQEEQTLTIAGWNEGVPQMKLGKKATFDITSDYAYDNQEFSGLIPKSSNLIFDVETQTINQTVRACHRGEP
jgi:hypothetical protein